MNLVSLEIPEDSSQLAGWLEQHLVGLELAPLVAELSAVHGGKATTGPSLEEVLGTRIGRVLSEGLSGLPPERLKQFLVQPQLLLELQELILMSGGTHWDQVARRSSKLQAKVERGRRKIGSFIAASMPEVEERNVLAFPKGGLRTWLRRRWLAGMAAAAAVLVAILLNMYGPRPERGEPPIVAQAPWGWNKQSAFREDLPAKEYLAALADSAAEWFNKRPETAPEIAKRIGEFRQGCSALVFAEHRTLAAIDRVWLLERCRAWADKLDQHLKAVEGGADPVKVRGETDETVTKLINAIRTRSKELQA